MRFTPVCVGTILALLAMPSTGWSKPVTQTKGRQSAPQDAKDNPKKSNQTAPAENEPVTVKGQRSANKIDRQIYDVTKDPQSETGTAADTLQKIPGVTVTASGEVSNRGNPVEIRVNGKPSPLLAGDNRGAALRAMPSNMISSVEVMSNPSAQYGSSGAGGIINIVTKKINLPGSFGNLSAQLASTGGGRINGFIQRNKGRYATNAFFSAVQDYNEGASRLMQSELNTGGDVNRSTESAGKSKIINQSVFSNVTVDYDVGATDTLTGLFNFADMSSQSRTLGEAAIYDGRAALTDQYSSQSLMTFGNTSGTLGLTWTRIGKKLGETLKVDSKVTHSTNQFNGNNRLDYILSSLPDNLGIRQMTTQAKNRMTTVNLGVDYNTFVGDDQVSLGVQIDQDDARNKSLIYSPFTPGTYLPTPNPLLTTLFAYRQTINAGYMTYQKAFGDHWAVLAGFRAEALNYESRDAMSGAPIRINYANLNPSLFATYVVSDTLKARFNYSRRLQRPTPWDLNPSTVYVNNQTVTKGTPALRPQEINSFEAAYEYVKLMTSYAIRVYRLENSKVINPVTKIITDPLDAGNQVVQISRQNAGASTQTGLQFTYSGMFTQRWSVNGSTSIYTTRMRVPDLPGERSLTAASAQVNVSYQPTDKDSLSLSYNSIGRQLTGDGYASGYASGSLFYNRSLTSVISLTLSTNNILKTKENLYVNNVGAVRRVNASRQRGPIFFMGLSRRFNSGSFVRP